MDSINLLPPSLNAPQPRVQTISSIEPVQEPRPPARNWITDSTVFTMDSFDYLLLRKEALLFNKQAGLGDVFTILKTAPVGDISLTTQQTRHMGHSDDEIDIHRKAYKVLTTF